MPELPEVESARRLAERLLAGQRIVSAACADDRVVFDRAAPGDVEVALKGRLVTTARRKGKYWWLVLDRPPYPVFHFGMSGRFVVSPGGTPLPRAWKLSLALANGDQATISDVRRLGRIRLAVDPEREPPLNRLGFDALTELPSAEQIQMLLAGRTSPLKAVLLDQSFAAGVGNWVADEVLYQARISPLRAANRLSEVEIRRLREALADVVRGAVAVDADSSRFPPTWLFHHRWDRHIATSPANEPLVRQRIHGRTTVWAPDRQR